MRGSEVRLAETRVRLAEIRGSEVRLAEIKVR